MKLTLEERKNPKIPNSYNPITDFDSLNRDTIFWDHEEAIWKLVNYDLFAVHPYIFGLGISAGEYCNPIK